MKNNCRAPPRRETDKGKPLTGERNLSGATAKAAIRTCSVIIHLLGLLSRDAEKKGRFL